MAQPIPNACGWVLCPNGTQCKDGKCEPNCLIDEECPCNQRCQNGTCRDPCAGFPCLSGTCETVNFKPICAPMKCSYDNDCPCRQLCKNGLCSHPCYKFECYGYCQASGGKPVCISYPLTPVEINTDN